MILDSAKLALYDDALERAEEGDRIIKDLCEQLAKSQAAQEWDEDGEPKFPKWSELPPVTLSDLTA